MRDLRILDTALQPASASPDVYTTTDSSEHLLARFLFAAEADDEADRLPNSGGTNAETASSSSSSSDAQLQGALQNRGKPNEG
jgi:hypothetical protein